MGDNHGIWNPVVLIDDNYIGEAIFYGLPDDLLERGVLTPHWVPIGYHSVQLFNERDGFL